jgi:multidrug efflux pump subunit AcrA (membrane-fusion protein)
MNSFHLKRLLVAACGAASVAGCGGGSADPAVIVPTVVRSQTDVQRVTASGVIAPVDAGAEMDAAVAVGVATSLNSP